MKTRTLEELVKFHSMKWTTRPAPSALIYSPENPGGETIISILPEYYQRQLYRQLKRLVSEQIDLKGHIEPAVVEQMAAGSAEQLHKQFLNEAGYMDERFQFKDEPFVPKAGQTITTVSSLPKGSKEADS